MENNRAKRLYDAALTGDTNVFQHLLREDPDLLNRICADCADKNPLHISAMRGNVTFVNTILHRQGSSPSYYAMCLARDRDGRNPVHLAAIHGRVEILNLMNQHDGLMQAAVEKADRGGTILYLCVKYNQMNALILLLGIFRDPEFLRAKNEDGMTILHLAMYYNQNQEKRKSIMTNLIERAPEIINIKNSNGKTALDLYEEQATKLKLEDKPFTDYLHKAKASTGDYVTTSGAKRDHFLVNFDDSKNSVMVVASLIATMAFQAMINPPGGIWQDNLPEGPDPHRVGESVIAQTHPKLYRQLMKSNTIAFVSSLTTIMMLLIRERPSQSKAHKFNILVFILLVCAILLSVTAISISYATTLEVIAPGSVRRSWSSNGLIAIVVIAMWCLPVMSFAGNVFRFLHWKTKISFQDVNAARSSMSHVLCIFRKFSRRSNAAETDNHERPEIPLASRVNT